MKKLFSLMLLASLALSLPATALAANFCTPAGGTPGDADFLRLPCKFITGAGPASETTVGGLVISVLQIMLLVVGGVSVLFLMIGGFRYVTAYGNEEAAEGAKKTIFHAVLGLVIVILSFTIVTLISNLLIRGSV